MFWIPKFCNVVIGGHQSCKKLPVKEKARPNDHGQKCSAQHRNQAGQLSQAYALPSGWVEIQRIGIAAD
jgi:hypothetical protein